MKKLNLILTLAFIFGLTASISFAGDYRAVSISKPTNNSMVSSPVTVCMVAWGVEVEPAKKGVNEGKGHHHIIVDVELPDLGKPIPKDANHIHMGDGSTCKTIKLSSGKHTIRTLFAKGNHMPYTPALSDTIFVEVK
jgi:hypothetical protein